MSEPALPGFHLSPSDILRERHYLGPVAGGLWYEDCDGVLVFDAPTARNIPKEWVELVRWCITGPKNAGTAQWARAVRWLRRKRPHTTTVVSYSDPSVGHTGALYRAAGWLWAPTWHRLRPPPTGNGRWAQKIQAVKDRWVYPLRPDAARFDALTVKDGALRRACPWAEYVEPTWKRGRPTGGGGDYRRWIAAIAPHPAEGERHE